MAGTGSQVPPGVLVFCKELSYHPDPQGGGEVSTRETQSRPHRVWSKCLCVADRKERPGVRRVKRASDRALGRGGGGRSPEKLLGGESCQGQGAHPSSLGPGASPLHDNEGLVWTSARGGDSPGTLVSARGRSLPCCHEGDRREPHGLPLLTVSNLLHEGH